MTVKQNEKGLWDVQFYYKDWTGKSVKKHKRNFKTKREAVAWVNQFTMQQAHNLNMDFKAFWEIYRNCRVKDFTLLWKPKHLGDFCG